MATWFEQDFAGGTVGESVWTGGEDFGFDSVPTSQDVITIDEVRPGVLGMRPRSTGYANLHLSAGGRTEGRVGGRVLFEQVANASVTAVFMILAAVGSANNVVVADLIFRNNTANQGTRYPAHRRNFTYIAPTPSSVVIPDGATYSWEMYWDGADYELSMWEGEDTSVSPTYAWSGTGHEPITGFLMGPDTASGVDAVLYDIWATDGERRDNATAPATFRHALNGYARHSEASVSFKIDGEPVTLGVTIGGQTATVTDKGHGYYQATAQGLAAGQVHTWTITLDGSDVATGQTRTLPAPGDPLRVLWGSCLDTYTSQTFTLMQDRDPDLILQLGDFGYQYITGGPNGNTSPTDVESCIEHRETALTGAGPQALFTAVPFDYTYSDCDGAGSNADRTTGGHATGAVQEAYRTQFAHPDLPLTGSGARSWEHGRVRFVHTDETVAASPKDDPDVAGKTKLGAEQLAWFKDQITAAAAAGQVVVWVGDGGWLGPAGGGGAGGNNWQKYDTERQEIAAHVAASGVPGFLRIHGDDHSLYLDDGTNNTRGGFPVACAAPMHTTANVYSATVTDGSWPETQTNSSRQYGVLDVVDDATGVHLTLTGYSSTNQAPSEVVRYQQTFTYLAPTTEPEFTFAVLDPTGPTDVEVLGVTTSTGIDPIEPLGIWDGSALT